MCSPRHVAIVLSSLIVLLSIELIVAADAEAGGSSCSVCGTGLKVGNSDGTFSFPGQPAVSCSVLEGAGEGGLIPLDQCHFLMDLIYDVCDCQTILVVCDVCEEPGYEIVNGSGVLQDPSLAEEIECSNIQQLVKDGLVLHDDTLCALLPDLIDEFCGGCTAPPPIVSPTAPPTGVPIPPIPTVSFAPSNPTSAYPNEEARYPVFGSNNNFNPVAEEEQNNPYGMILLLAGVASVGFMFCGYVHCKREQEVQSSGGIINISGNNVPATLDNNTTTTIAVASTSSCIREEKEATLRPQVLEALFPGQKGFMTSTTIGDGSSNCDDSNSNTILETTLCSICLEELEETKDIAVFGSSCAHVYHRDCILKWLNKKSNSNKKHDDCPNCRQPMWDPDTYQIVQEDIARRQNREQAAIVQLLEL